MAWARNLTLLDADQEIVTDEQRYVRRSGVPTPDQMAAKYIEVRDQILASPPPRPTPPAPAVPTVVSDGKELAAGAEL